MAKTFFLTVVIDTIFLSFISFISIFLIVNYFLDRKVSIIISLTLSLLLFIVFFVILKNKKKSRLDKEKNKSQIESTCVNLSLKSKASLNTLAEKIMTGEKKEFIKRKGYFFIEKENTYIFIDFNVDGIKKSQILKVANIVKGDAKAKIFCYDIKKEELEFSKKFKNKITFIYGEKIYFLLKKHNLILKDKLLDFTKKPKIDLSNILAKKRAKNYLVFGISFAFFCFFVRLKVYYIVFACIFLTLFILSFLFGKKEKINP